MITTKKIKEDGPLISACVTTILFCGVTNYSYLDVGFLSIWKLFDALICSAFAGCVIYTSCYTVQQKYKKQYRLWCYFAIAIFYVFICSVLNYLLSSILMMDPPRYYNNLLTTIFYMFMPLLIIGQFLLLKKLTKASIQAYLLVLLTLLTLFAHFADLFIKEINFLTPPFHLNFLIFFISFLFLLAFMKSLSSFLETSEVSYDMKLWSIRLAFILGFVGEDFINLSAQQYYNFYGVETYLLAAVIIIKFVIIWFCSKKFILPIQPLYILWTIIITIAFSRALVNSLFYFLFYTSYLLPIDSEIIRQKFAFNFVNIELIVVSITNILMIVFSFKLFFPRKTSQIII